MRKLFDFFDAQAVPITVSAQDGSDHPILYVNARFAELSGYAPAECVGRDCRFLQDPEGRVRHDAALKTLKSSLLEARPDAIILPNLRKDRTPFMNSLAIEPLAEKDGRLWFLAVQSDVSRTYPSGSAAMDLDRGAMAAEAWAAKNRALRAQRKNVASIAKALAQMSKYYLS